MDAREKEKFVKNFEDSKFEYTIKIATSFWSVLLIIIVSLMLTFTLKLEARAFPYYNKFSYSSLPKMLPGISSDPRDIEVFLYSRLNPHRPQRLFSNGTFNTKTHFDPKKVTKILIHGFSAGLYFAKRFVAGN